MSKIRLVIFWLY